MREKKYIEVNKTLSFIEEKGKHYCMTVCDILNCKNIIKQVPIDDVREVRHGEWKFNVEIGSCYDYHVTAHCSKCGWEWIGKDCSGNNRYVFGAFVHGDKEFAKIFVLNTAREKKLYNYCPNCGAKMYKE